MNGEFEVIRPWADIDPQPLWGLAPPVGDLAGKTVGLLFNLKLSARPILSVVEERLRQRYPTLETSWYMARPPGEWLEYFGPDQDMDDPRFQDWVKGVDAVVAAVGD